MIGKIIVGKSFGGCVRYVVQKEKVEVLYGEGIRLENTVQITRDFNMQRKLNPELGQAVAHVSLNFSTNDKDRLTNEVMLEMAREYLKEMNIRDTQVLIVRHNDANHPHCHLIYNRVDNHGKTISDAYQRKKNSKVCKDMTLRYGLYMAEGKSLVNRLALKGPDKQKYQMHDIIRAASLTARNWEQFEKFLEKQGVMLQYKYAGKTAKVQGVSFKMGEYSFKGSELDRNLSFGKLDKMFEVNQGLKQAVRAERIDEGQSGSLANQLREAIAGNSYKEGLLDILLNSEIYIAPEPEPFRLRKKRKAGAKSKARVSADNHQ